jgi:hypothetical protein
VKVWQVRGHSGKKYTLTLANKDFATNKIYTWEIKRKLDTKEVRDYGRALYEQFTSGSASKLWTDGTHTPTVEDVKSLYGFVGPVERGNVIVAIREVGYNIPNDVFKSGGLSGMGYNPMTEVIYTEPVEICQLTDKANWGANREDLVLTTSTTVAVPNNNYFRFHNNAIAEDILNNQSKCNNYDPSAFGPEEAMDWSKYDGAFTAYVEVAFNDVDACAICDEGCYEIFDPNNTRFFNIRCDRPVYMTSWKGDEIKQDALNKEVSTQISFGFEDWRPYTISTNYESDGDKYVLGSYYERYDGLPTKQRYRFDNVIGSVETQVLDEEGEVFAFDPRRDDSQFIKPCSDAVLARLSDFTAAFIDRYLKYTSGAIDPTSGYRKLAPYLLADSDLDRRMKDAVDGLTWAHTETINVDSARLNGALDLGEHYYICDISSIATTFETGKGEVESVSNMRVIVRERNDDVRAIALELY